MSVRLEGLGSKALRALKSKYRSAQYHSPLRHPLLYSGHRYLCPACGGSFRRFLSVPGGRRNAICPRCGARERQRLLWLYLTRETDLFQRPQAVLHFAPEPMLAHRLASVHGGRYVSADVAPRTAMERIDITDIPKPDGCFDVVICSHVLEHVPDDLRAMREVHRVLKSDGVAILQHPIDYARDRTYEDADIVEASARLEAFRQADHVRVYGRDFGDRLNAAGFECQAVRYRRVLPRNDVELYGLVSSASDDERPIDLDTFTRGDDIYLCRRSDRS